MSIIDLKIKTYDELTFEITRLNTDKYLLEQKLQQKENIIKEVRKYVSEIIVDETYTKCILEILDKVGDEISK